MMPAGEKCPKLRCGASELGLPVDELLDDAPLDRTMEDDESSLTFLPPIHPPFADGFVGDAVDDLLGET